MCAPSNDVVELSRSLVITVRDSMPGAMSSAAVCFPASRRLQRTYENAIGPLSRGMGPAGGFEQIKLMWTAGMTWAHACLDISFEVKWG